VTARGTARSILGQRVDAVSQRDAVNLVLDRAQVREPGAYVCLTNVHTTVESQSDPGLRAAVDSAFLSVPDGMPLVWILRHRGDRRVEKVTGIEYIPRVAAAGRALGLRHFFFGGHPGIAEAAAKELTARVPGTEVVGVCPPPFGPPESWDLAELRSLLQETRPHVMWVGLGAPKQELWMASLAGELDVPIMVGVGAAFDFLAGVKRTAPRVLSRLGLEWLFRLLSEPRRLWRRYIVGNTTFAWLLLRETVRPGGRSRPGDLGYSPDQAGSATERPLGPREGT